MDEDSRPPFQSALKVYLRARSKANRPVLNLDRATEKVDQALDALLAVPSPSTAAFGQKIRILEAEYGVHAQPRHLAALYADVAILTSVCADWLYQNWPAA